ncbi:hypothetical protein NLU13_0299 [Sarocladium strictum]|uniref:DUF676 domain-containing protein n=1 Tax=Sarocladium strictum TaxID=5046 RepID=A0AA39LAP3_SARSR|nr:hypothetical protein NLU13_0299 [Sarocladium strictum]
MSRTLLLCFVHGFKGTDNTFHDFPDDLRRQLGKQLPDHTVKSIVYPKYETKGELAEAAAAFLEWLKERVMDERKTACETPWPPSDDKVGVVLVAHSMGGFVAVDTLFLALNERASNPNTNDQLFPLIQGILTFDTPFNGLARSMFVYGAFSNYSKVTGVFNAMTALSAAAPATLSKLGTRSTAAPSAVPSAPRSGGGSSPAWTTWQLIAVRSGTVGAIAAGGVAAYTHREAIMKGVQNVRNMNRESIARGYRQSVDALGQGLAYINRGNVGKSFAWLSDHFTFVGALMKQKELNRRLERLGALKGVGIQDFYCSLGENGYWSGGYFVPERTFCAVPEPEHSAYGFFTRRAMLEADDEIQAHLNLFKPGKHKKYEDMVDDSAQLVKQWFLNRVPIEDDPKFKEEDEEVVKEDKEVEKALEQGPDADATPLSSKDAQGEKPAADTGKSSAAAGGDELPDESPIDIAAAASLVPLPGGEGELLGDASTNISEGEDAEERQIAKRTYVQHLFGIAQSAGNEAKGWWPSTMPTMPTMPKMPESVSSLSMPRVSVNPFSSSASKKQKTGGGSAESDAETKQGEQADKQEQQQAADVGEKQEDAVMSVEK